MTLYQNRTVRGELKWDWTPTPIPRCPVYMNTGDGYLLCLELSPCPVYMTCLDIPSSTDRVHEREGVGRVAVHLMFTPRLVSGR